MSWQTPLDLLPNGRWPAFYVEAITAVAYAAFALALGGLLIGRTVPCNGADAVRVCRLRLVVAQIGPRFPRPTTASAMDIRRAP